MLTISLSSFAAQAAFNPGFYVGGSVGGMYTHTCADYGFDSKAVPNLMKGHSESGHQTINIRQGKIGLFGGYLFAPCGSNHWLRMAPEACIQLTDTHTSKTFTLNATIITDRVSYPWSAALNLRTGAVVGDEKDIFCYGLIGATLTSMEWKRKENGTPLVEQQKHPLGFTVGVGIEKELPWCHRIGIELKYTIYGRQSFKGTDREGDSNTYNYKPSATAIELRYSVPF